MRGRGAAKCHTAQRTDEQLILQREILSVTVWKKLFYQSTWSEKNNLVTSGEDVNMTCWPTRSSHASLLIGVIFGLVLSKIIDIAVNPEPTRSTWQGEL